MISGLFFIGCLHHVVARREGKRMADGGGLTERFTAFGVPAVLHAKSSEFLAEAGTFCGR